MSPDAHPNDEYVNPTSPTTGPPVPPEVFPDELAAAQGAGQGGTTSSGGDASPAPASPDPAPQGDSGSGDQGNGDGSGDAGSGEPRDYTDLDKPAAQAEVERRQAEGREITVTGTGADGNVLVGDLREALIKDDEAAKTS